MAIAAGTPQRPGGIADCRGCAGYYITHDPAFPYGCRILGFHSRRKPCIEVEAASGEPCRGFTPKPARTA
ncbi:hypothetical protein [Azoarcus olearius]|uniref:Uracil-DNA glycosylase n=1 Tax=Azoarcus sp. (strain BH72) TaxID=418699 RepID=A1KCI6_AZOSB|nr:hypothetical protein [Azoarcus olearius]ANQ87086.1 hypothetical protein dqs_4070 [Azoarcus olearius]CAL96542.1 conserved hypothetical protein [Azoarcus olearius]